MVIGVVAAVVVLAAGAVVFVRGQGGEAPGQAEEAEAAPPPIQLPPGVERASIGVMPTEENTGVPAGITLRPSGPLTIDEDGAVVEGLDIDGCVQINASDVTLRYSRIRCGDDIPVRIGDGAQGVLLEDIEIDGLGNPQGIDPNRVAVGFGNYTLRRADIHDIGEGPRMSDNSVLESSFIHDIAAGDDGHNDGVQSTDGSDIVMRGNRIENLNTQTSAICICADAGDIDSVLIEGNWLRGGGYTVYHGGDGFAATNVQVVNNKFGRDHVYGPLSTNQPDTLDWRDNTYDDNGEVITP